MFLKSPEGREYRKKNLSYVKTKMQISCLMPKNDFFANKTCYNIYMNYKYIKYAFFSY